MQLHTKILLGMVIGAVLGLALGPQSPLLNADIYKIADPSALEFYAARTDPESTPLPAGVPTRFHIVENEITTRTDKLGESHALVAWSKVRFRYAQSLALRDPDGTLRAALGDPKPGEWATGWIRIAQSSLNGGGFAAFPTPSSGVGDMLVSWVQPVGKLFMRLLKMVIVPLVFASLLVGVASLGDIRKLGRLGGRTLALYLTTTAIAVTTGLLAAYLIQPGSFVGEASRIQLQAQFQGLAGAKVGQAAAAPSMIDNLLRIVPENPIASLSGGDMLQVIFFAVILGVALTMIEEKHGGVVVTFFDRIQEAMVVVIHLVMKLAPFGVAALIAEVVGTSGWSVLKALLVYTVTVLVGLLFHGVVVYGSIARWLARIPLASFLRAVRPAQLIAFSTSSSSASLPVSMECAEQNLGVSNPVASFVLPLGSTVNMDGTALYQGVAAIFIAQVFGIDLDLGGQLAIVLTATLASIGAAGVPGAGIVTLAMVLTATGIPAVGIALVLGMDRLLDMFRTSVNVTGDLAVTSAMAVAEGERLSVLSPEQDQAEPRRGFERDFRDAQHRVEPDA